MYITLIGIGAIVFGVVLFLIWWGLDFFFDADAELIGLAGAFIGLIGLFYMAIVGLFLIGCRVGVPRQIAKNQIRYEGLLKEVELLNSNYEDVSKVEVVKEITKWNDYVNSAQYWSENPWTSWFYVQEIVDGLDYIEVPNLN